ACVSICCARLGRRAPRSPLLPYTTLFRSQVLIEADGQRVVVTGDYKRLPDRTAQPFELVPCDLLVTEATFGLPVFQHPHPAEERSEEHTSALQSRENLVCRPLLEKKNTW